MARSRGRILARSKWLLSAEIGYFIFAIAVALVLFMRNTDDLSIAALWGAGSFVGLSILGYFVFEKAIPAL